MDRERNQNKSMENWNKQLDLALKNLPERFAPADFMLQVMAKIQSQDAKKLKKQSWRQYPLWLRIASTSSVAVLIVLLSVMGIRLYETNVIPALSLFVQLFKTVLSALAGVLLENKTVFGIELFQYILPAISFLILGMYLTCIGAGTFLYRTVRR